MFEYLKRWSPLSLVPRFRVADRSLRELAEHEGWDRSRIDAYHLTRLQALWDHARKFVPYYRDLAAERGIPENFGSVEDFQKWVPPLEKATVRESPESLLAERRGGGYWLRTSGSTGVFTRVYWEKNAHLEKLRCKYRCEQAWGVGIFDRKAMLWGDVGSGAIGWRDRLEQWTRPWADRMRGRLRLSAYRLCDQDLEAHLQALESHQSISLYGYSSAVTLLARRAAKVGWSSSHLKLVVLTGEPADESMIRECQLGFQCGVAVEYGSVECGLIGYRFPDGQMTVREDLVMVETDPRSDGRFDLLVTVLNNPSFPLFRYRIGDTTDMPLARPDVGFARLLGLAGRANDLLYSRCGTVVHSMAIKHTLESHPAVRRFRATQEMDGRLIVELETDENDAEAFAEEKQRLAEWLDGFPVHIVLTPQLPPSQSGKLRWIQSKWIPMSERQARDVGDSSRPPRPTTELTGRGAGKAHFPNI